MRSWMRYGWLLVLLMLAPVVLASEKVALVIGNSGYADRPLVNPKNDAQSMARVLTGLGFSVTLRLDRNIEQLDEDLRSFGQTVQRLPAGRGVALFYFAGHGVQREGESYLIPEMVVLGSGRFRMGSPASEPGRDEDEGPVREVRIGSFALGVTELRFRDWDLCLERGGCGDHKPKDAGWGWGRGDRPVVNVSWSDAQKYMEWLRGETGGKYRLPSESEWEYGSRAGTTTAYWWGAGIDRSRANYGTERSMLGGGGEAEGADRWEYSSPVKSFASNPWGLYDTSGNVHEWVQDCYVSSYAGAPMDGSAVEQENCEERVLRGASWFDGPERLRSANRHWGVPLRRISYIGFRLALNR